MVAVYFLFACLLGCFAPPVHPSSVHPSIDAIQPQTKQSQVRQDTRLLLLVGAQEYQETEPNHSLPALLNSVNL